MEISTYLTIITLNVNELNASIKRHKVGEWIKKRPKYASYKRFSSDLKTHID